MIGKPLLALLAAPFIASASEPPKPIYADIPQVRQVLCPKSSGTAFRVGSGAFVTGRHVTAGGGCMIDGELVNVTWQSADLDIAIIRTKVYGKPLEIDCGGYKDKEAYAGVGHAKGLPVQRVIFVLFVKDIHDRLDRWMGFTTLFGDRFIPGMSGGPVFNSDGKVVGIVNGLNVNAPLSYSQALRGTPLCASEAR